MAGRSFYRSLLRGMGSAACLMSVILLLIPGTYGAGAITPVASIAIHRGAIVTGAASYAFCGTAKTSPTSAYVCETASVQNATGSAQVWAQISANTTLTGIKGNLYWWFNGAVNLSAGFAKLRMFCTHPLQASGAVIVYVSVGLTDITTGIVGGGGGPPGVGAFLWSSNTASCTHGGATRVASSPALSFAFNSSTYGLGGMFIQHQHTYLLSAYIGCEVVATVYNASAPVSVSGSCNNAGSPASNTFSMTRLSIT